VEIKAVLKRLLDSVILIDHFNNISKATDFILGLDPGETAISVISRAEILVGFDVENIDKAKSLLDQYTILTIEKDTADTAEELRRMYGWKLPDAFQAALAIKKGIKFSTRNTKDFDPIQHSFVEIPYQL
jgi:predicted nucleic acid-binding protein